MHVYIIKLKKYLYIIKLIMTYFLSILLWNKGEHTQNETNEKYISNADMMDASWTHGIKQNEKEIT